MFRENEKGKKHINARRKDAKTKEESRLRQNEKNKAKYVDIRTGDKILLKQTKTTLKPPFDPNPYVVYC